MQRISSSDAYLEPILIRWLIDRETGRNLSDEYDRKMEHNFTKELPSNNNLATARAKFWRAKIALILVNDIDNPYSRKYLGLKFDIKSSKLDGEPVFGVLWPDPNKTATRADKVRLLQEVYKIIPSNDPILKAECLLSLYELQAKDNELPPTEAKPLNSLESYIALGLELGAVKRSDVAALFGKADESWKPFFIDPESPHLFFRPDIDAKKLGAISDPRKQAALKKLLDTSLLAGHGHKLAKPANKKDNLVNYFIQRIPSGGLSDTFQSTYVPTERRTMEAYRYVANALTLQARLIMLRTNYNDPDYPHKMAQALDYLALAGSPVLVGRYEEKEKLIRPLLDKAYKAKPDRAPDAAWTQQHNPTQNQLLPLLALDQMKATAAYKLGLYYQVRDRQKSQENFALAKKLSEHTRSLLEDVSQYMRRDAASRAKIDYWRAQILGTAKMLLADITLAQDTKIEDAIGQIDGCLTVRGSEHLVRSDGQVTARLSRINALLQQKAKTYKEQQQKVKDAKAELSTLSKEYDVKSDPFNKRGAIALAQAKIDLAEFYLDEKDQTVPLKVRINLDDLIRDARRNNDWTPTPASNLPGTRPNNGVLEDYELSSALQLRGETYFILNQPQLADEDYARALSVFSVPQGDNKKLPLNHFAQLGRADMANWSNRYGAAETAYKTFLNNFAPVIDDPAIKEAGWQAEIGLQEVALRRDRKYGEVADFLTNFLKKGDLPPHLRKRALFTQIELYSSKHEWHGKIIELYAGLKEEGTLLTDPVFQSNLLRKVAEAHGWLKQFAQGRALLGEIKNDPRPDKTNLVAAELDMRDPAKEKDPKTMVGAAGAIFKNHDDPQLVLKTVLDLLEASSAKKDFAGMIALSGILLGDESVQHPEVAKARAEINRLYPDLNSGLLQNIFKNYSKEARQLATLKIRSKYADGLMWQKDYKAALAQLDKIKTELEPRANAPHLTDLEYRLTLADAYFKSGEIFRYRLKDEDFPASKEKYFADSLADYDQALAILGENKTADNDLEDAERLALANVYIGRGEVRRYAKGKTRVTSQNATPEDIRNYNEAKNNYLLGQKFVKTLPEGIVDEKYLLFAKLHNGLGKVGEVLATTKVIIAEHFQKAQAEYAKYLQAGNLPPEGGLGYEIDNGLASSGKFIRPSSNSGQTGYTDRYGRAEQRVKAEVKVPVEYVIPGMPKELVTANFSGILDHGNNALLDSFNVGADVYIFDREKWGSLTCNIDYRIAGNHPDASKNGTFDLLPQAQSRIGCSVWNDYFTGDLSRTVLSPGHSWSNSWFASLYWNGASVWKNDPYLRGFRAGLIYNHLPYAVAGEGYRTKDTLSLALDYQIDLSELFTNTFADWEITYGTFIVSPYVRVPLYQFVPLDKKFEELPDKYDVNQYFPAGTFEAGLDLRINARKLGIFTVGGAYMYNRDFSTKDWDYRQWQLRAGWLFVIPDLRKGKN